MDREYRRVVKRTYEQRRENLQLKNSRACGLTALALTLLLMKPTIFDYSAMRNMMSVRPYIANESLKIQRKEEQGE